TQLGRQGAQILNRERLGGQVWILGGRSQSEVHFASAPAQNRGRAQGDAQIFTRQLLCLSPRKLRFEAARKGDSCTVLVISIQFIDRPLPAVALVLHERF